NLTVNTVCPAFVDTPMVEDSAARIHRATGRSEAEARDALAAMNANGRLVTAAEVADSIVFLCRPSRRSITGACLTIDGGTTA
ncbi:MAG TPA: SDR family oxidoreductase, partial [Sphingomicrobium sp.]|nr:SDR family oxidoreductase [Sphingomicrobium sp.]